MILGEKLKSFRKSKRYTQAQFAEIIGIKRSGYAAYEVGRVGVSTSMLHDLSKHFNMTIDQLLKEMNNVVEEDRKNLNELHDRDAPYKLGEKKEDIETIIARETALFPSDFHEKYNKAMEDMLGSMAKYLNVISKQAETILINAEAAKINSEAAKIHTEAVKKQADAIESQQITIRSLTSKNGDADGRAATSI